MITTKQRSSLRALAHTLTPVVIIGKDGVTQEVVKTTEDVLEARELIKIKVLNTSPLTTREVSSLLCQTLKAEGVQCIGNIVVIYRYSHKKGINHIEF